MGTTGNLLLQQIPVTTVVGIHLGKLISPTSFGGFFTNQKGDVNRFHKENFEDLTNEIWDVSHFRFKLWIPVAKRGT
jgi:hypothetical protein